MYYVDVSMYFAKKHHEKCRTGECQLLGLIVITSIFNEDGVFDKVSMPI